MKYAAAMAIALIALAVPAYAAATIPTTVAAPSGEYIVGFFGTPGQKVGDLYLGTPVKAVDTDLNFIVVETSDPAALRAAALLDANVRYVEYNDPMWATPSFVPNDPLYSNAALYGLRTIGAATAWDKTLGSTAVKVAVIDSGRYASHEDLQGSRHLAGYDYYRNDGIPEDNCGHGTHTYGTIGANTNNGLGIPGIAQVTMEPLKALDKVMGGCYGSTTALVNALKGAADRGAAVSSNSWGGGSASTAFNDAIAYAYGKGVLIVAAAGNSGPCTECVGEPWVSNPSQVLIVSATNANDAFATTFTGSTQGSSQGATVDISAPGDEVGSTYMPIKGSCTTNCYVKLSGTSMATPHVAGVAALVKSLNPTMTNAQISTRLTSTAVDLGPAGWDVQYGYGRLNAAAAVF